MGYTLRKYSWIEFVICVAGSIAALIIGINACSGKLWPSLLSGCSFALTSGTVLVFPMQYFLRKYARLPWNEKEPKTSDVLGYVERAVVFGACVVGYGQYAIAGWVALKTVSQWKGWNEKSEPKDENSSWGEGRARFNIFLVGTALSIIAAIGGALFSLWLYSPEKISKIINFGLPR